MNPSPRPTDLREACIAEAFGIVAEEGVESLSLRDVARRLGVSHQAPYKHFASRDHILAEIVSRSFDEFAAFLQQRPPCDDAAADLHGMGMCYLDYARLNPLKYRLMFNTPLPDPGKHPGMMRNARHAFGLLRDRLADMPLGRLDAGQAMTPDLDALFVWSTLHGLASILQFGAVATLQLTDADMDTAVHHCMARLGRALGSTTAPS